MEETVRRLEEGNLRLEESIALFERCVELLKYCQGLLDKAELRVKALLPTEEGPRLVDYPLEEGE
ncbi:MAG: exodeoxyribonuclease VII small subunit [Chloroflexi bacterium]|nr:exodeoxyribonuclease VII small subunit [Chloroflexota bacterium]